MAIMSREKDCLIISNHSFYDVEICRKSDGGLAIEARGEYQWVLSADQRRLLKEFL